ncbi:hypothetical protein NXV57_27550 [Bacteroides thetaiotaomicron]|nr:hypothetical protein [Bacteroides thetaiotaomicron]
MGQILPGVVVAFENPKGRGREVYADKLVCRLYSFAVKRRGGLSIAVVDIDDMQNTIGKLREDEAEDGIMKRKKNMRLSISLPQSSSTNWISFRTITTLYLSIFRVT